MKLRKFIESNFSIDHPETGALVPFAFRPVQAKYYDMLCSDYNEQDNFKGLREIILKARKEGFTSFVLGLFCADIILSANPVRYLEISYRDDATVQHFRRAKTFVLSYFKKKLGIEDDKQLEKMVFSSISEGSEFVLAHNKASFYVGTASTRTGERGGTVQGILFSESAHYPDTGILRASEIIEGTKSMVAVGSGMVFQESTANSFNHFKDTWDSSVIGTVDYKPRFFSWQEFYTPQEFEMVKMGFSDKSLIPQEFPDTPEQAFLVSGQKFFDNASLNWYIKFQVRDPIKKGFMEYPNFHEVSEGLWSVWEEPQSTQAYLLACDFATSGDYQAVGILKQKTCELVATFRGQLDTIELAKQIVSMAQWYNVALVIPEVNGIGLALLLAIQSLGYSRIYQRRQEDTVVKDKSDRLGFLTTSSTRPLVLGELHAMIKERSLKVYDRRVIGELLSFIRNPKTNKPEAIKGKHDDFVMMLALLIHAYQESIPMGKTDELNRTLYGENYERINEGSFLSKSSFADKFKIGR